MLEKVFGDYVEIGISMLAAALLLFGISVCMGLNHQYQEKQLESQVVAQEIKEQRNNLFYNNTHVYQQDIVSLILRYKGDRTVIVKLTNGNTYEWSTERKSSNYKVSEISALLPKDVLYDADLMFMEHTSNLTGYEFVQHQAGCGR